MNVKVFLSTGSFMDLTDTKVEQANTFPDYFTILSVTPLEPLCPFCGSELQNAKCFCTAYKNALQRLLKTYNHENLSLRTKDNIILTLRLKKGMVKMTAVPMPEDAFILFDQGSMFTPKAYERCSAWHISLGNIKENSLQFFMRKDRSAQCYSCVIDKLDPHFVDMVTRNVEVEIYRHFQQIIPNPQSSKKVVFGNYHFKETDTVLERLSLDAFLTKLIENA